MALDSGKKEVKLKTIDSSVPYVPAKSTFSIVADAFEPTLKRLEQNWADTARANYFNDFQIKTREAFIKFSSEFENDPNGMKTAVDTYSTNLLEKAPPRYKVQVQAMLASYSTNAVIGATNKRLQLDETKLANDDLTIWENINTDTENNLRISSEIADGNIARQKINDETLSGFFKVNEHSKNNFETFVKTEKRTDKKHEGNIEQSVEDILISRGVHMMMTMNTDQALEWLNLYANNKDGLAMDVGVKPGDGSTKDNPIYQLSLAMMKDDDTREKIVTEIYKKYKIFNGEKFKTTGSSNTINYKALLEPNNILSWEQDQTAQRNGHDVAMSINGMEFQSEKYNKVVEKVNYNNYIQSNITSFMQSGKLIDFKNDQEKKDTASAILANFGIHEVQMGFDQNGNFTDSFLTATNLLSELNIFPDEYKTYLQIEGGGTYENPAVLAQLREKLFTFNYLTSDDVFPNWAGGSDFLKWAAEQDITSRDDVVAAEILNSYKDMDWDKRITAISNSFNEGNKGDFLWMEWDRFDNTITKSLHSPNAFVKFFMDEKNLYHKHLLEQSDQTTWVSWDAAKIMSAQTKIQFQNLFINEMALMSNSDTFDVWADENSNLREKAWHRTLQKLKDGNYGIESHTGDGVPKLVKDPFWLNKGSFNDDDVYAAINQDFHMLSKSEQLSKWGTNDFNVVLDKYFKIWADDNQGDVKLSLDNDGTNNYNISFVNGADVITLNEKFEPHKWTNIIDKDSPASATQVVNHTADAMFKEFQKTAFFKSLDLDKKGLAEKFIYGTMRQGLKLGNWRWYPDIPGLDDTPVELRPFHFIARALGHDGDLRELRTTFQTMNGIASESLSFVKKINANRKINDTEKAVEALYPPDKMTFTKNNMSLNFATWTAENYQNTDLALTHRTNNWGAVSSDKWNGEMDVNYKRDSRHFAVFKHPVDSIRASVKTILNHSSLTAKLNDVDIRYDENPTIEKILTMYAEDTTSYFKSLEAHTDFDKTDTIDLLDSHQMHKLLKFIVKHEMGFEYYNKTFGTSNRYVDAVIIEGYKKAINSYNGELGKL